VLDVAEEELGAWQAGAVDERERRDHDRVDG
jgi:hypothetical protein